jgi:phage-related baseplate assembly protein
MTTQTSPIDLSLLPAPDVIEPLDFEQILAERKAYMVSLWPESEQEGIAALLELESEPLNKLAQESAYRELILRQRINDSARGVMLAFARGSDLDHLGARDGVTRLLVDPGDSSAIPPRLPVYESDERFRQRIQLALEGFSTAGPVGAYTFHALAASAKVKDVSIDSHTAGIVTVTLLGTDGDGTPDAGLLDTVAAALNDEDVRPLCDTVEVQAAQVVPYQVEASLRYYSGPDQALVKAAAEAAVAAYVAEHHRLGHDITRSGLFAALHRPGVQNVILTAPAEDLVITSAQAAYCTGVTVSSGGLDV